MADALTKDARFVADSFSVSLGGQAILGGASLWAARGEITALLGRNGSGKSTLLRAALGLVPREAGHVNYDGVLYDAPTLHELARRGLYYLPDGGALSPHIACSWQIETFRRRVDLTRFEEVAASLGLDADLLARRPAQLSGGERSRVEIALAVSRSPRCLLADEPLASVEPLDRPRVLGLLRDLANEGAAIVLTGHDARELMAAADDVVWMRDGRTIPLGDPEAARADEGFRRGYLGA